MKKHGQAKVDGAIRVQYLEHKDAMIKGDLETHGFQYGDTLMKSFPFNLCPFILAQFLLCT